MALIIGYEPRMPKVPIVAFQRIVGHKRGAADMAEGKKQETETQGEYPQVPEMKRDEVEQDRAYGFARVSGSHVAPPLSATT
jgi:hypothetical protein